MNYGAVRARYLDDTVARQARPRCSPCSTTASCWTWSAARPPSAPATGPRPTHLAHAQDIVSELAATLDVAAWDGAAAADERLHVSPQRARRGEPLRRPGAHSGLSRARRAAARPGTRRRASCPARVPRRWSRSAPSRRAATLRSESSGWAEDGRDGVGRRLGERPDGLELEVELVERMLTLDHLADLPSRARWTPPTGSARCPRPSPTGQGRCSPARSRLAAARRGRQPEPAPPAAAQALRAAPPSAPVYLDVPA